MIDIANILRLASDGYDVRDIRLFTRVPVPEIKKICKDAGVHLNVTTERVKPIITVVKDLPPPVKRDKPGPKMEEPAPPLNRPNPLNVAKLWLGTRLVEKPTGYWLDNRPVNLTSIMRAANALIKEAGATQLDSHPDWLT